MSTLSNSSFLLFLSIITMTLLLADSQSSIVGVNYDEIANNLPPLSEAPAAQSPTESTDPKAPATPHHQRVEQWCIPKAGVKDTQLHVILDIACGSGIIDCSPILPGGACYEPNTVASHAAFAINLYFQKSNRTYCNFYNSAMLTSENPSYRKCIYPSGST